MSCFTLQYRVLQYIFHLLLVVNFNTAYILNHKSQQTVFHLLNRYLCLSKLHHEHVYSLHHVGAVCDAGYCDYENHNVL